MAGCALVRVALISDCYLPRLGGIEVQVHDLALQLQSAGHEVTVITATGGGPGGIEDGIQVHRLALPLPGGIPINPLAPPQVRRLLAQGDFDVAHVHMGVVSPFAVSLVPVALEAGLPTAITWHCVIDRSAPWHRLRGRARRWAQAGVALSAVSRMAADRVEAIADAPVAVLGNGIDPQRWRRPADLPSEPAGGLRVVSAIRLASRKRPHAVIDVLARARALLDPAIALDATIFGDGPQRTRLLRMLDAEGMDWVRLAGRVSRDELRTAYWHSDIYLSTARLESFGIAALEARCAGLVVAARSGTGVEDFVTDGVDGILAPSDDVLASRIADLGRELDALRRMQTAVREAPVQHSWPAMLEQTLAEYHRAGAP